MEPVRNNMKCLTTWQISAFTSNSIFAQNLVFFDISKDDDGLGDDDGSTNFTSAVDVFFRFRCRSTKFFDAAVDLISAL